VRLKGLNAIVTGATSGFGKAIAILFAKEGANVAVVGRNGERGEEVVRLIEENGGRAFFSQTDVTVDESVKNMVESVIDRFGHIDILINNAGVVVKGAAPDLSPEEWERSWQTNVTSVYLVSHYVLPHMLKRKCGVIVNMGSTAGIKGFKDRVAYCAAKFAVVGMTKAMAVDHSKDGVRVNCICPGAVETEAIKSMIENSPDPEQTRNMLLSRRLTPCLGTIEEIAEAVLFLALPQNRYLTGAILNFDGGTSAM
jgi:Dehydrogenases with different specificities (related to short-chain alcohol dehydrogenases)